MAISSLEQVSTTGDRIMNYDATVPRQLVHRVSPSEVLLTDFTVGTGHTHRVAVQLPTSHRVYRPVLDRHDPLLIGQSLKQTLMLLTHTRYEVPIDSEFLIEHIDFRLSTPIDAHIEPASLAWIATTNFDESADDGVPRIGIDAELRSGSATIATGSATARCLSPSQYERVRNARGKSEPHFRVELPGATVVNHVDVDRAETQDVVLSQHVSDGQLFFTPDPRNTALFEQAVDRVPGEALVEAARQAVRLTRGRTGDIAEISIDFRGFTEWEPPSSVHVSDLGGSDGSTRYLIHFTQGEQVTTDIEMSIVEPRWPV